MDPSSAFVSAVSTLHCASAGAEARAAANAWLVDFSSSAAAAAHCAALLGAPGSVCEPAVVAAAGIVASAAEREGEGAVEALIGLCAGVRSRAALSRLAAAAASIALRAGNERALLASHQFGELPPTQQLALLHALAQAASASGSAEELAARPTLVAVRREATAAIAHALLAPPCASSAPVPADAALRCLAAWAEAGLGLIELGESQALLLSALTTALCPRPVTTETYLALAALRAAMETSRDLGEEVMELEPLVLGSLLEAVAGLSTLVAPSPHGVVAETVARPLAGKVAPFCPSSECSDLASHSSRISATSVLDEREIACEVVSVAALLIELCAGDLEARLGNAGAASCAGDGMSCTSSRPTSGADEKIVRGLHGLLELMLCCTSHEDESVAELVADGWLALSAGLGPRTGAAARAAAVAAAACSAPTDIRTQIFGRVAERLIARCARHAAIARRDDWNDLCAFRERVGRPLLSKCSEALGAGWLVMLVNTLPVVVAHTPPGSVPPADGEALLFACSCTSPRCIADPVGSGGAVAPIKRCGSAGLVGGSAPGSLCGVCASHACAGALGGMCGGEPPAEALLGLIAQVLHEMQRRLDFELDVVDQSARTAAEHADAIALLTDYAEAARQILEPPLRVAQAPGVLRCIGGGAHVDDDGMGEQ